MLALKILVLVFIASGGEGGHSHHYYVTANNRSDCPSFSHCRTLSEYIQQKDDIFVSHTTVEFLPGLHEMNNAGLIPIGFVKNLTLIGSDSFMESPDGYSYSDSVVFCTNYSGFFFVYVTELKIINITFAHCGAQPKLFLLAYIALGFLETTSLVLSGVTVEDSIGFGLYGLNNWKKVVVTNCNFIRNNEYVRRTRQCIDPSEPWTCLGGNARLFYSAGLFMFNHKPTNVEISHSTFMGGVAALNYAFIRQPVPFALAAGLDVMCTDFMSNELNVTVTINSTVFKNNSGPYGGNMYITVGMGTLFTQVTIHNCSIEDGYTELLWPKPFRGRVHAAGLVYHINFMDEHSDGKVRQILKISNTRFSSNIGGAMALVVIPHDSVMCNSSGFEILIENSEFTNNSALSFSAGVFAAMGYIQPTVLERVFNLEISIINASFHNNIEYKKKSFGVIRFYQFPKIAITNSTFINNSGSPAIYLFKSKLFFAGNILFQNNTNSTDGGALYLHETSLMYFKPGTTMLFRRNTARHRGGAIYVETHTEIGRPMCFFQLEHVRKYTTSNVQLIFEGNHANHAGLAIYGGRVDTCYIYEWQFTMGDRSSFEGTPSVQVFDKLFNFSNSIPSLSLVSSDPIRICFCNNNGIDYSRSQILPKEVFPGQLFEVEAIPIGQYNGTTPGVIVARTISNTTAQFEEVQRVQQGHVNCTSLQYSISSERENESIWIQLTPQGVSREFYDFYSSTFINVTLKSCPPGFQLQHAERLKKCNCDSQLTPYNVTCNISDQSISKAGSVWMNATFSKQSEYLGLIVHSHCPFDYCTASLVVFSIDTPDAQCSFNRSAILCGACLPGYSLALGTSRCLKCSNAMLSLLLPLAIAGLVLVFVLMLLNLTVSTGTINGLIFYANIVRANHAVFFPPGDTSFFTVFIAWLNLDLGIETCFWDGLDGYGKTWLQFLFPVYIWVIVIVIIALSRRYVIAGRLFGRHAVPVLATLFLLSYAKLLRTIITVFSFTTLSLPDGSTRVVWLYDGNVGYLAPKHTVLLLVALGFLLCFVLPFTLLVVFAPCLQAHSNKALFRRWVNRLKPLLDAYQGPYKDRYRCWTGVMLVMRNVLFFAFALNALGDPVLNLELINTAVIFLLTFMWLAGTVYKAFILNALEALFIAKLGVFSAWTIFIHQNTNSVQSQLIIAYCITATTVVIFFVMVAYHTYHCFKELRIIKDFQLRRRGQRLQQLTATQGIICSADANSPTQPPTVTYVDFTELRETLLTVNDRESI